MKSKSVVLLGSALLALTTVLAGCTASGAPADLDNLGGTDARFDTSNPDMFAYETRQNEDGWAMSGRGSGQTMPAVTVDSWTTGVEFVADGARYTLAGLVQGPCEDYSRELMAWLTDGRKVLLEPVAGSEVALWVLEAEPSDAPRAQLANAYAARFGVGTADGAEHWLGGIVADETSGPSSTWRPKTWECLGRPDRSG